MLAQGLPSGTAVMKATVDVVVDSAEEFQVFWIANPLVEEVRQP